MAEEFDESEVVFSQDLSSVLEKDNENEKRNKTRQEKAVVFQSSLPVNIPDNMRYIGKEEAEEEYSEGGGGEVVPPHVVVGRRIQGEGGKVAFSVCSGSGRTLKGRDLSRVRNSVLRLTGYLEA